MARVLELFDETQDPAVPTGDTATLASTGKVTYQGKGVRNIIQKWLAVHPPNVVFRNVDGWSNGYVSLREKEQE